MVPKCKSFGKTHHYNTPGLAATDAVGAIDRYRWIIIKKKKEKTKKTNKFIYNSPSLTAADAVGVVHCIVLGVGQHARGVAAGVGLSEAETPNNFTCV